MNSTIEMTTDPKRNSQPNALLQRSDRLRLSFVTACALAMACFTCAGFGGPDPSTSPRRMIGGRTADLQPLFDWWSNQRESDRGERPLPGWKHVHGSIVRETAFGWIIRGEAEGENQPRFLVKNPPREQLLKFQELHRQLAAYERQRTGLNEYLQRPVRTPYSDYWGYESALPPINSSDQQAAIARLEDIERTIAWTHEQIGSLEDEHGNFRLDAFALRINERYEGLPVFDHGYALPGP